MRVRSARPFRFEDFDFSPCLSMQTIPVAMASLRNVHGICPADVLRFLFDLFKYNENMKNSLSDNYYRAALIEALGNTVTPVVSLVHTG